MKLPWPPKELSPNSRTHWAKKAKITKAYRTECGWITRQSRKKATPGLIDVHITFCPPDKRRRDIDNMLASCKGLIDGVADGLGVDDSRFVLHISRGEVVNGGAVMVAINDDYCNLMTDKV